MVVVVVTACEHCSMMKEVLHMEHSIVWKTKGKL